MIQSVINSNPQLQSYYTSLESRIGYRLVLGNTRHFGYYKSSKSWPLPVGPALREMEKRLFDALDLSPGSKVLDAGCGVGHVAIHAAQSRRLQILGIDVIDHHLVKARRNVVRAGLDKDIDLRLMDYHNLDALDSSSFDGVYTMETFVHATDPEIVLKGFFRLLKPGGTLVLTEYDHIEEESVPERDREAFKTINKYGAMPAYTMFGQGVMERMLAEAGFVDIELRDFSDHIVPMLWLFYVIAYIPYMIFCALGIQHYFINTMGGFEGYRGRAAWRFVQVKATKPLKN